VLLSWCSGEGIGVSNRLIHVNIVIVGLCLHIYELVPS
jgi:hypothetical protein